MKKILISTFLTALLFLPATGMAQSYNPNNIFERVSQESFVLEEGENELFVFRINAPDDLDVRIGGQDFSLLQLGVELEDITITARNITTDEDVESWEVDEETYSGEFFSMIEFPIRDFAIPERNTYEFVVTADVEQGEGIGIVSVMNETYGIHVHTLSSN